MRSWGWGPHGGSSAFTRDTIEPACLFVMWERSKKVASCNPKRTSHLTRNQCSQYLDLGLPASRSMRNECLLLKSPSLCGYGSPSRLRQMEYEFLWEISQADWIELSGCSISWLSLKFTCSISHLKIYWHMLISVAKLKLQFSQP